MTVSPSGDREASDSVALRPRRADVRAAMEVEERVVESGGRREASPADEEVLELPEVLRS